MPEQNIPTVIEFDCATQEQTVRPMSAAELKERDERILADKNRQEQEEAADAARALARSSAEAKLAKIGLTADEIAALLT
jgi:hypothetical protein